MYIALIIKSIHHIINSPTDADEGTGYVYLNFTVQGI